VTLGLIGVATVMAFLVGTLVGTISGWKRNGAIDSLQQERDRRDLLRKCARVISKSDKYVQRFRQSLER